MSTYTHHLFWLLWAYMSLSVEVSVYIVVEDDFDAGAVEDHDGDDDVDAAVVEDDDDDVEDDTSRASMDVYQRIC